MSSLGQDYPFYLYLEALVLFLNSPVLQPSSIRAAPELRGQSSFTVFPRATYDASLACGSCMSFYSQLWHTMTVLVCKANPCCYQKRSHPCSHLHVFFSFFICPLLLQCCAFRWVIITEVDRARRSRAVPLAVSHAQHCLSPGARRAVETAFLVHSLLHTALRPHKGWWDWATLCLQWPFLMHSL